MRSTAAAAVSFSSVEDLLDVDGLGTEFVSELVRDIAESVAELPRLGPTWKREFSAGTPVKARAAAVEWLRDFGQHGPLQIEGLRTLPRGELFVAVVTCRSTEAVRAGALDENAMADERSGEKSPAEPDTQPESSTTPEPLEAHLFTFESPVVRKLPVVTPLQLGGVYGDRRVDR